LAEGAVSLGETVSAATANTVTVTKGETVWKVDPSLSR